MGHCLKIKIQNDPTKSKKIEFGRYSKTIFANDNNPEFVTEAKLFGLLNYTVYRTRNPTWHDDNEDISQFYLKDFLEVTSQDNDEERIIGKVLLGYDMVNSYFYTIKELSSFQNFNQNSRRLKDDLNSFRVKSLFNKIKVRRETSRKVVFKERLARELLPF